MGVAGFGAAIGVHFLVGYVDFFHLLPAFAGFFLFITADVLLLVAWRTQGLSVPEAAARATSRSNS